MNKTKWRFLFISLFIFTARAFSATYEVFDDLLFCPNVSQLYIVHSYKEGNTLYGLFKLRIPSLEPFDLPAKLIGSKMHVNPEFIDLVYENLSGDWVWYRKSVHNKKPNQIINLAHSTDYEIVIPLPNLEQVKFSRTWVIVVRSADGSNCIASQYLSAKIKQEPVVKRLKSE